jgi:hypothetical protein
MAENASGEVEDAQRRAAPHGAGVDDVAHAAGASLPALALCCCLENVRFSEADLGLSCLSVAISRVRFVVLRLTCASTLSL